MSSQKLLMIVSIFKSKLVFCLFFELLSVALYFDTHTKEIPCLYKLIRKLIEIIHIFVSVS